jgi:hypothetical protein
MGRFSRAFVAIAVAAALLVSCSSSGKSPVASNVPLTKDEYIKQSDAICNTYRNRINNVVASAGQGLSLSAARAVLIQRLIPLFQAEHQELLQLRPPKADAARLAATLRAMNGGINTIVGRVNSATSIDELNAINPRGIRAWKTESGLYGMHICGSKTTTGQ